MLQKLNKDLKNKLDEKEAQNIVTGYRSEDLNASDNDVEYNLRKLIMSARDKIKSEDITIDYHGVLGIKEKHEEILKKIGMLEEQVKILLCNIN